jgi:hypothetical protein
MLCFCEELLRTVKYSFMPFLRAKRADGRAKKFESPGTKQAWGGFYRAAVRP